MFCGSVKQHRWRRTLLQLHIYLNRVTLTSPHISLILRKLKALLIISIDNFTQIIKRKPVICNQI